MRVTFIAVPLTARSGVYRSGRELVAEGRRMGHDWNLLLGVSSQASGAVPPDDPEWIDEFTAEPGGIRGIRDLRASLARHPLVVGSDLLVSLIPQTDMALALSPRPWIAFLRGLPWPEKGESSPTKRVVWKALETIALRRPAQIWATTSVLRDEVGINRDIHLVPAGIAPIGRTWDGRGPRDKVVWAARYNHDKNPRLFFDALAGQSFHGVMHGSGELEEELRGSAPENVSVAGWTAPSELWADTLAYVGTSHREAFGRSALEAAMSGIPVVLGDSFGVAPFLVTDPRLRDLFVLPVEDSDRWRSALSLLYADEQLRTEYSEHLIGNAASLTIEASAETVAARIRALPSP